MREHLIAQTFVEVADTLVADFLNMLVEHCADIAADAQRWPRYVVAADTCGFRAVHVLPMRLRQEVIGELSLLSTRTSSTTCRDTS
ncbi:hypothetical protein [Actinophytocola oryzae]|uniref:hypothetical protein n=1 Tax=Actinophytocola oryzae TaxID=502181 RepID=UPI001062CF3F|nr:hypothetical protein [Actinophytocola oryzae]